MGASVPHRSVQLDVSSQVTLQGDPAHVMLQLALCLQSALPPVPMVKVQLDARQTMFAPLAPITVHVAPSVQVASQVDAQLPLHALVAHER